MASTSDVLDRHLKCFAEYDLEGVLADYPPDAVLFVPTGLLKGPDAIKPLFESLISEFANRAPRSRCSSDALMVITPIFSGPQKQHTIRTNSPRTRFLCGTVK